MAKTSEDLFWDEYQGKLNRAEFDWAVEEMVNHLSDAYIIGSGSRLGAWNRWVRWMGKQDFMEGHPKSKAAKEARLVFDAVDNVHAFS